MSAIDLSIGLGSIVLTIPTSLVAYQTYKLRREQDDAKRKAEEAKKLAAEEVKKATLRQQEIQTAVNNAVGALQKAGQAQIIAADSQVAAAGQLSEIHTLVNSEHTDLTAKVVEQGTIIMELQKELRELARRLNGT